MGFYFKELSDVGKKQFVFQNAFIFMIFLFPFIGFGYTALLMFGVLMTFNWWMQKLTTEGYERHQGETYVHRNVDFGSGDRGQGLSCIKDKIEIPVQSKEIQILKGTNEFKIALVAVLSEDVEQDQKLAEQMYAKDEKEIDVLIRQKLTEHGIDLDDVPVEPKRNLVAISTQGINNIDTPKPVDPNPPGNIKGTKSKKTSKTEESSPVTSITPVQKEIATETPLIKEENSPIKDPGLPLQSPVIVPTEIEKPVSIETVKENTPVPKEQVSDLHPKQIPQQNEDSSEVKVEAIPEKILPDLSIEKIETEKSEEAIVSDFIEDAPMTIEIPLPNSGTPPNDPIVSPKEKEKEKEEINPEGNTLPEEPSLNSSAAPSIDPITKPDSKTKKNKKKEKNHEESK